eukprot:COSAG01_NODE_4955_length_4591_cov_6.138468_10_plen_72_part_00
MPTVEEMQNQATTHFKDLQVQLVVDGILPLPRLAVAGALDGRLCRDPPAERSVSELPFSKIVDLRPSDLPI